METTCKLRSAIGNDEECTRGWCAFWERDRTGRALEGGCVLERLGVDFGNVSLAYYLDDLRSALERAAASEAAARSREEVAQLVPPDLAGS